MEAVWEMCFVSNPEVGLDYENLIIAGCYIIRSDLKKKVRQKMFYKIWLLIGDANLPADA